MDLTQHTESSTTTRGGLNRRRLLTLSLGAASAAALAACGNKATTAATSATSAASAASSATGASSSASTTATAASNTKLSAGSYTATFSSDTQGPGGGSGTQKLSGAYLVNGVHATIDGGTWASTSADQNVFLVVNGGSLTISNATIQKSGSSSNEDACNFYGLNSAVLVVGKGSSVTMTNCHVTTASEGSNGLFASGSGTLNASNVTIRTSKNSSRGLDATYAGVIKASGVDIATTGAHCACVATDRGNGNITVTGKNTLSATGDGSPLIYSTGDISVSGATGKATGAQTMVIEGKNKITLADCIFTTSGTEGMMIYQSFSGDAADSAATASTSSMTITNSTITSTTTKPMIYVTNTSCQVNVTNSTLTQPASAKLLSLEADRWGTSGSNGGKAAVVFDKVTASGAMAAGSTSSATVQLKSSKLTGATSGSITVTKHSASTYSK